MKLRLSTKNKWILVWCLIGVLSVGMVSTAVKLNDSIKTETLTSMDYEIGGLTSAGAENNSDGSIRTKDFITTDGFEVKMQEDAEVTYRLYFYDADESFISMQEAEQTGDYVFPATGNNAAYVKVVITPTDDTEITMFEKGGYCDDIEVTYDK